MGGAVEASRGGTKASYAWHGTVGAEGPRDTGPSGYSSLPRHLAAGRRSGGLAAPSWGKGRDRSVAPSSSAGGCTPVVPGKSRTGRRALGLPLRARSTGEGSVFDVH